MARRIHGRLVASWLVEGLDAVIAHGPIVTPADEEVLLGDVAGVTPSWLLRVPFAVAAERVAADPTRVVSKDLAFLRSAYDTFEATIPSPGRFDCDIGTSITSVPENEEHLASELF